jgi:hypothetical protein
MKEKQKSSKSKSISKIDAKDLETLSSLELVELKGGRSFKLDDQDEGVQVGYVCGNANVSCDFSGNCVAGCACPPPK